MAGPTVTLAFAADSSAIEKAFSGVSQSADKMAGDVGKASQKMKTEADKGFDGLRDGADNSERRFIGLKDAMTGTGDVMTGLKNGDVLTLTMGMADLASSVANLGADMLEWGKKAYEGAANVVKAHGASVVAKGKDIAATVAHKAASVASTVATGAQTAAQWALNAAMSANPIMLVVLGLGALVAAFVVAWNNSETFRKIVTGAFDAVKGVAEGAFNWVKDNWPLLLGILTGPIGLAVLAVVKHWDSIKNGFGAVKDWISQKVNDIVSTVTGIPGRIGDVFAFMADNFRRAINGIISIWNNFGIPRFEFSWDSKKVWTPFGDKTIIPGGSVGLGPYHFPDIPMLAKGGITTGPTLAMIGEGRNDEAVIPLPHGWRNGGFGMGGGSSVTVVIQGNVFGVDQLDRAIQVSLARAKRRGL